MFCSSVCWCICVCFSFLCSFPGQFSSAFYIWWLFLILCSTFDFSSIYPSAIRNHLIWLFSHFKSNWFLSMLLFIFRNIKLLIPRHFSGFEAFPLDSYCTLKYSSFFFSSLKMMNIECQEASIHTNQKEKNPNELIE